MLKFSRLNGGNQLLQFMPWRFCFKIRKRRMILIILCMPLILMILAPIVFYYYFFHCSHLEVLKARDVICEAYFKREAFGNLCHQLCQNKSLVPRTCIPNHLGKDVVFEALYNKRSVIIKTSKLNANEMDQIFWTNETNHVFYPTLDHFYDMIRHSVIRNLNLTDDDNVVPGKSLVKLMWSVNLMKLKEFSKAKQNAVMSNIWFLVQQPEYLLLKYHASKHVFPYVIGTCGHFYVEEFAQPLSSWFTVMYPSWKETFLKRAKLALKIIQYLEKIEIHFPKLQICDVKVAHFGLSTDGNVKLLDMDMVFYEPALIQNMVAIQNCTKNDDCSFIDCQGLCNINLQECKPVVVNTNFQRVCKNIFAGKFAQKYFGLLGLPPVELSQKLPSLLHQCSFQMNNSVATNLMRELKILLKSVISA